MPKIRRKEVIKVVERAVCNKCGATYTDKESIEMVRKWIKEGYAPCPNLSCPGQMELKKEE